MENGKGKLEQNIMSKIRNGKVKLRSRYIFLAEKLGLESAFVLSVILSVLFINLFFFYLKATDNLEYLSFGSDGIYAFLESFPYLLIAAFIFLILFAGYLLARADFSYKKPFKYFAVILMAFIFVSGGVLAYTDIPEMLEEKAFSDEPMSAVLNPFLKKGIESRKSGVAGEISEIEERYIILATPHGIQKVSLENIGSETMNSLKKDSFIIAVGERRGDVFIVKRIRVIVDEQRMPMIKRRIYKINTNQGSFNWNPNCRMFCRENVDVYFWM